MPMITESDCKNLEQLSSQLLHFFLLSEFLYFHASTDDLNEYYDQYGISLTMGYVHKSKLSRISG